MPPPPGADPALRVVEPGRPIELAAAGAAASGTHPFADRPDRGRPPRIISAPRAQASGEAGQVVCSCRGHGGLPPCDQDRDAD